MAGAGHFYTFLPEGFTTYHISVLPETSFPEQKKRKIFLHSLPQQVTVRIQNTSSLCALFQKKAKAAFQTLNVMEKNHEIDRGFDRVRIRRGAVRGWSCASHGQAARDGLPAFHNGSDRGYCLARYVP
jgi:hypothetical protein